MKRLKLEAFKAKNLKKDQTASTDQLLGQVLGNCHDTTEDTSSNNSNSGNKNLSLFKMGPATQ